MTKISTNQAIECARRYEDGESLGSVATAFGITRQAMWTRLRKAGVQMRPQLRYGEANHFYRGGGRKRTDRGYIKVYKDGRWLFEHREVMKIALGRPLNTDEDVHHINGQKDDNRPENLELIVHSGHSSLTGKGRTRNPETVAKHRAAMLGRWMHRPDITTASVKKLYDQGLNRRQIGLALGCSGDVVTSRLRAANGE